MDMSHYMSVFGIVTILAIAYAVSADRKRIKLSFVLKALLLQFCLAFLILKTAGGQQVFQLLSDGFTRLYSFADAGSSFVFGGLSDPSMPWGWIFGVKVVPIIIFFGALTSVLFHLGIVQLVVSAIAFVIRPLLGTTGAETLCAAANSMLGQTEAPLLIKNYLKDMTDSELIVVMISGFATLSGSILAVYGGMGVPMLHLLSASVMSIPGSILIAKMLLPETEKSKKDDSIALNVKPETKNILDAIAVGTQDGMRLAVNVAAMLIAFISLISLVNYLLASLGAVIGLNITLDSIFGKLFSGVAYLLGVPLSESHLAGALLGKKLVINEFVAFDGLVKSTLSSRSQAILTYALCGFANFSCIGIQIGGIGALVPSKRDKLIQLGLFALLGGTLANFLNAAIAALFI